MSGIDAQDNLQLNAQNSGTSMSQNLDTYPITPIIPKSWGDGLIHSYLQTGSRHWRRGSCLTNRSSQVDTSHIAFLITEMKRTATPREMLRCRCSTCISFSSGRISARRWMTEPMRDLVTGPLRPWWQRWQRSPGHGRRRNMGS